MLNGGFTLNADNYYLWNVETHGQFDSVDEMATPDGFWDLFVLQNGPVGPLSDDGSYTRSASRSFATSP